MKIWVRVVVLVITIPGESKVNSQFWHGWEFDNIDLPKFALLAHTNHSDQNSPSASFGGPLSRVCARETLCSAWKFSSTHVCSHFFKISPFSSQNIVILEGGGYPNFLFIIGTLFLLIMSPC